MMLIAIPFAGSSQCPSNKGQLELALSYGTITSDQMNIGVQDNNKTRTYNPGNAFITVRYFLYSCLAFGFAGGTTNERGQYTDPFSPSFITSTYKKGVTTIALEAYYVYFFRKYLEVYTLLGVGPAFTTNTTITNPTLYAPGYTTATSNDGLKFQYAPIGVRIGGRLGGFIEAGIGYKGLINGGLSFKIGPSCWWKQYK